MVDRVNSSMVRACVTSASCPFAYEVMPVSTYHLASVYGHVGFLFRETGGRLVVKKVASILGNLVETNHGSCKGDLIQVLADIQSSISSRLDHSQ